MPQPNHSFKVIGCDTFRCLDCGFTCHVSNYPNRAENVCLGDEAKRYRDPITHWDVWGEWIPNLIFLSIGFGLAHLVYWALGAHFSLTLVDFVGWSIGFVCGGYAIRRMVNRRVKVFQNIQMELNRRGQGNV